MKIKKSKFLLLFITVLLLLSNIFIFTNNVEKPLLKSRYTNRVPLRQLGFIGYTFYDVKSYLDRHFKVIAQEDIDTTNNILDRFKENRIPLKTTPNKNVILVQLESVDGICLDINLPDGPLMPNLKKISEKSIYFPNAYDLSGSGRTTDGEILATSSILPIQNENIYTTYDLSHLVTLPKVLKENGYSTFSIHGFESSFYGRNTAHPAIGYDNSYFLEDLNNDDVVGWGVSDKSMVTQAVDIMKEQTTPFMAHLITLTNHHPYDHINKKLGKDTSDIVNNYYASIRYTDESIGLLFNLLEESNILDNSIVVFFSDHDSSITKLIHEKNNLPYANTLKDDRVVLVAYTKDEVSVNNNLAAQLTVAPLVLNKLGLPIPKNMLGQKSFDGVDGLLLQNGTFVSLDDSNNLVYNNTSINMYDFTQTLIYKGDDLN